MSSGDRMTLPRFLCVCLSMIGLFLILGIVFTSGADGDVAIVPGAFMKNNTMGIDLNITENGTEVEVSHDFILETASHLDSEFWLSISDRDESLMYCEVREPEGRNITKRDSGGYYFTYRMYEDMNEQRFIFNYSLRMEDTDGFTIMRSIMSRDTSQRLWTMHSLMMTNLTITITANKDVTVFNGTTNVTGTTLTINVSEHDIGGWEDWDGHYFETAYHEIGLTINWTEGERIGAVLEFMEYTITDPYLSNIPNLIDKEFVAVTISERNGRFVYDMNCTFHVNRTILYNTSPAYLWFPENGTHCTAELKYTRRDSNMDENEEWRYIYSNESLEVVSWRSNRFGQNGFYIFIPDLRMTAIHSNLTLNVLINGSLPTLPLWDFVIVTVPIGESSINISYPSTMSLSSVHSPFTKHSYQNGTFQDVVCIHGICQRMEEVHLEWDILQDSDGDGVPNIDDDHPDDPLRWEKDDPAEEGEINLIPLRYLVLVVVVLIVTLGGYRLRIGRTQ